MPVAVVIFLALGGAMAAIGASAEAATLRCPPRLPDWHPGFEQVGPVPAAHWLLRRMRLFAVPSDNSRPAELAPAQPQGGRDNFSVTWRPPAADDLLMQCLYDGSGTYYLARLHQPATSCTWRDDNGLSQAWCDMP